MIEAIVAVALRAIIASVVLGGALALGVLALTRSIALTASARHALWTTALLAIGVMPFAGIGVSLWKGAPAADAGPSASSVVGLPAPVPHSGVAAHRTAHVFATTRPPSEPVSGANGHFAGERLAAAAGWTPRLSHSLALGAVAVWGAGALIGLIGLGASIVRVRGLKRRSSPLEGTLADELPWLTDVGPGREIYLRLSFETETPVAIGFRRPVILIPTELATADGLSAIEPLIMHEHAHLRRFDDWTNLVQRAIERVFWFNPIVWVVGRRIALEREIASDDAVVDRTGEAHRYASSLWRLAREMRMPEHAVVAPGALLTRKQISVRIEQLLDKNRARLHRSPGAAAGVAFAALVAVAFVATSAPAVELPAAAPAPATAHVPTAAHRTAHDAAARPVVVINARRLQPTGPSRRMVVTVDGPLAPPAPLPKLPPLVALAPLPPLPVPPALANSQDVGELAHSGRHVAADVKRAVHDALSEIPGGGTKGNPSKRAAHYDGMKVSRELVAACTGCSMQNADLRGADLHGLRITAIDFTGADLRNVNLAGAQLTGVSLTRANLSGADLRGTQLTGVDVDGAHFDGAALEGVKLTGMSLQHTTFTGASLRGVIANCTGCDLSNMDLHGQDLHGISLTGADLSGADLRDVNLSGARFVGVDLSSAKLAGADLTNAHFDGCDLSGASLRGAKTTGMTIHGSGLDG